MYVYMLRHAAPGAPWPPHARPGRDPPYYYLQHQLSLSLSIYIYIYTCVYTHYHDIYPCPSINVICYDIIYYIITSYTIVY